MKMLVSIVLIALLSVAACLYLPWWSIAVVAFIVAALIPQSPGRSFLTGFIALFLLWGSLAWVISSYNDHLLAQKVSTIVLSFSSAALLIVLTALIGALVAGFAALAGSYLRKA